MLYPGETVGGANASSLISRVGLDDSGTSLADNPCVLRFFNGRASLPDPFLDTAHLAKAFFSILVAEASATHHLGVRKAFSG